MMITPDPAKRSDGGVEITVNVPLRDPFEPNATQKQKDYIWRLGYQEIDIIKKLGRRQAAAMIDGILRQKKAIENPPIRIGRIEKIIFGCLAALFIAAMTLLHFKAKEVDEEKAAERAKAEAQIKPPESPSPTPPPSPTHRRRH